MKGSRFTAWSLTICIYEVHPAIHFWENSTLLDNFGHNMYVSIEAALKKLFSDIAIQIECTRITVCQLMILENNISRIIFSIIHCHSSMQLFLAFLLKLRIWNKKESCLRNCFYLVILSYAILVHDLVLWCLHKYT